MYKLAMILTETGIPDLSAYGLGGALAALVFYFYRQDRIATEKRFEKLADDFRTVIQENTKASTALQEAIKTVVHCPYWSERNGKPQ